MIRINVTNNGIELNGHATREDGHAVNEPCAAVSAMTLSLLDCIEEIANMRVQRLAEKKGHVSACWQDLNERGAILVEAFVIGVKNVAASYSGSLELTDSRR